MMDNRKADHHSKKQFYSYVEMITYGNVTVRIKLPNRMNSTSESFVFFK